MASQHGDGWSARWTDHEGKCRRTTFRFVSHRRAVSGGPIDQGAFRSGILLRGGNGNGPAVAVAEDCTYRGEPAEGLAEARVADAKLSAELGPGERPCARRQLVDDEAVEVAVAVVVCAVVARVEELEMGVAGLLATGATGEEAKAEGVWSGGGAMRDARW